jgi:signal transduction histidine kinase
MVQNQPSVSDVLYLLSQRLANVATVEDLLEAAADYPASRGASAVVIFSTDSQFEPQKLHGIAQWSCGKALSGLEALFRNVPADDPMFALNAPLFIEDREDSQSASYVNKRMRAFLSVNYCRSSVVIPLRVNQHWIGVIQVVWKSPQTFSHYDRQIYSILGHQVSWVIYGVGLHHEIQDRIRRAELLLQLSTNLSQASDEQEILMAVAPVVEHYNADVLSLTYIDMDTHTQTTTLTPMARWMRCPETSPLKPIKLGKARSTPEFLKPYLYGIPVDEAVLFEQMSAVTQDHDPAQLERTGFNYATSALIPLWRGSWQGFVTLNWTEPHAFSDEEHYIYSALIPVLAPVIASRRAYLAQEAARRESEQRAQELETVSKVSAAASQNLELEQLLQTVVDLSKSSFNLYNAHLYLLDAQGSHLVLAATSGETGKAIKALGITRLSLTRDPSIAARCGRQREGVIVNDVYQSADFIPNPLLPEVRSEMAVPMVLGDSLIGVLNLQSKEINRFTPNVLLVMRALADEIAVAVRNVHLFEEQLRVTEELRTLDKLKNQFLANMSHELRTPLNAILNFTYFVSSGLFGAINEKQVGALTKVSNASTHLLGLINDILDFSKIEAGMMQMFWEEVNLNTLLENVIATVNGLPRAEQVEFVTDIAPDLPIIRGDKQRIRQILLNLLSNALKFTQQGSVTISVRPNDHDILFTVSDTGPGISAEDQEAIFVAFKQTEDTLGHGGTGLGLPISRHLAEAHGGKLWLTSELHVGSTFFVSLPIKERDPAQPSSQPAIST